MSETEEGLAAAMDPNELRLAANGRFQANALDEALPLYSMAVEVSRQRGDPNLVIHLCNRAACLYKMEMFEEARDDAEEAVKTSDGANCKAYFRLARSQLALNAFGSALGTIDKATAQCDEQLALAGADGADQMKLQKQEFEKLRALTLKKQRQHKSNPDSPPEIKSIKLEPRTPSIKEFVRTTKTSESYNPLGVGNFSSVVVCQHKITGETFALKIIEKEECRKLAKRQHPNVYNEVAMERRILTQDRLPHHVNIVRAYHAMQDYGNLYFLMDLHREHQDLWSQIRYKSFSDGQYYMVGCHASLIRTYMYELLSAVEHCHKHGVVHRDLKTENILLSERGGHVVLIDFGTARDLIQTNLNGPEFVGTPEFMSPEAVKEFKKGGHGCDFTADLWALGVILYQLYAGSTPFESQSPYLGFLKIQRGIFSRSMGVFDDDAWDLIQKWLKVIPQDRLGAGCFEWIPPAVTAGETNGEEILKKEENKSSSTRDDLPRGNVLQHGNGYDVIRQHPFFAKHEAALKKATNSHLSIDGDDEGIPQPTPAQNDLDIRTFGQLVDQSSLDVDLEDSHPPGDGSEYDCLRLEPSDKRRVMHFLDRLKLLKEPRNFRRFFLTKQEARLGRVRPESRDVLGLTQVNDKMGQLRGHNEDGPHPQEQVPAHKLVGDTKTRIHLVTNPLFCKSTNEDCSTPEKEAVRKGYIKQLKESIRLVNRVRPSVVVACGYFDDSCRKILSKVNETVPVVLHDGSAFFNFWIYGAHCVAFPLKFFEPALDEDEDARAEALAWLRMVLEQIKTARSHGYVFVDGDPRRIPEAWVSKLGKSHILGLFGLFDETSSQAGCESGPSSFQRDFVVAQDKGGHEADDEISVSSDDSEGIDDANADEHVMHIIGRADNGVRNITISDEEVVWDVDVLL